MTTSGEALRAVADLASGQWGLFTSAQARALGLTPQQLARLADAGAIDRVRHGVYRSAGTPDRPTDELRAAWLVLASDRTADERLRDVDVEVVSHRSAAVLHRLGDLDADDLEFTTARRKQSRDPQVRFHRRSISAADWTLLDGLPVTTVLTTIRDLAEAHIDGGHLAGVIRDAVTTQHVDIEQVAAVLDPYAHLYGVELGRGDNMLRVMLQVAGIPASTRAATQMVDPTPLVRQIQQALAPAIAMQTAQVELLSERLTPTTALVLELQRALAPIAAWYAAQTAGSPTGNDHFVTATGHLASEMIPANPAKRERRRKAVMTGDGRRAQSGDGSSSILGGRTGNRSIKRDPVGVTFVPADSSRGARTRPIR